VARRDLGAVLRIETSSFSSEAWDAELFRDYLDISGDLFLVAKLDGRIAGYSIAYASRAAAEIDSIAVLPQFRCRGVARALLLAILNRLRRRRLIACSLAVRRSNHPAIGLYRRLGFVRVRTIASYYPDGEHAWVMRRAV
jgi:ribosomal-protein-alanine N-acetyltransferase